MIIVAGGDSFVWGSELADSPHGGPDGYSRNTFTALLAKNHEYQCAAYPGNANDSIARMTINACEKNKGKKQAVIVSWTFPDRYEFNIQTIQGQRWEVINSWSVGKHYTNAGDIDKNKIADLFKNKADLLGIGMFAKSYFANVGFLEYWKVYTSFKEMVYLQNYLIVNKIPYLFTCADNNIFNSYTSNNPDDTIQSLYNQINFDNWFFFPAGTQANETQAPRGFYQWAIENKYSMGTEGHPLESAHHDAAELIKEKFNELVKKSI
jgi:hypothetical protein